MISSLAKTSNLSGESFILLREAQQPVGGEIRGLAGVVVPTVIKLDRNGSTSCS